VENEIETVELASPEWLHAIAGELERAIRGLDLGGKTYTVCEEFTDPPAHLVPAGATSLAWYFRVTDDKVEVGAGVVVDADLRTTVDYAATLPVARLVYGSTPEAMAEAQLARDAARATGTRIGDEADLPPQLLERLIGVHNAMAVRTR
jgi:hypothetical protein